MINKYTKRIKGAYLEGGIKGVLRAFAYKVLEPRRTNAHSFLEKYKFINNFSLSKTFVPSKIENQNKKLVLNWFMMDMGKSGGGDINIFRFIKGLNKLGHTNHVYITHGCHHQTDKDLKDYVTKHYGETGAHFHISDKAISESDACIATEWRTAYKVFDVQNTKDKFYFVQDFEPYFHPRGSHYLFAENTYRMGFNGITAGYWLENKLKDEYGMNTFGYRFTYDTNLYSEVKDVEREPYNIFFYARPVTPRRSYELGIMALNQLAVLEPRIKVYIAGWEISAGEVKFPHENLGLLKLDELSKIYSKCNIGFVLSATNCSLLPTELLACGCVPFIDEGPHNEWLVKDKTNGVILKTNPMDIALTIKSYLDNQDELENIRKSGKAFLEETDEQKEIAKVERFIYKTLS